MISYHFTKSKDIEKYLIELEAIKINFENLKSIPELEEKIRRDSRLKSALYSARIEGNPLHPSQISENESEDEYQIEVKNLRKAYNFIYQSENNKPLSINLVKELHLKTMLNLSPLAGKFRQEPWAIFDQNGNAIHLAPPYFKVPELMQEFVNYINNLIDHPAIVSAISQFIFEKIHPFADGNGRAGRLISAYILKQNNYHLRGMIHFEEYTDNHRQAYYYALEPSSDMTEFIEYFLKSLVSTAKIILKQLQHPVTVGPSLPFRRQEILNIITDHPNCSFDFLQRRFANINPKTLHYDLKKLQDINLVQKIGTTRGALYKLST